LRAAIFYKKGVAKSKDKSYNKITKVTKQLQDAGKKTARIFGERAEDLRKMSFT